MKCSTKEFFWNSNSI